MENNHQPNTNNDDSESIVGYAKIGFEKTKELGSKAVETVTDPEFKRAVVEKSKGAWEKTKDFGSSAFVTVRDARIPQKIGNGLVVAKDKISEVS